jgi:hypothetical protein
MDGVRVRTMSHYAFVYINWAAIPRDGCVVEIDDLSRASPSRKILCAAYYGRDC